MVDGQHSTTVPGHLHRRRGDGAFDDDRGGRAPIKHIVLLAAVSILPIAPALVLLFDPGVTDGVETLAYAGVFVVNVLMTAHVMPLPGASALGQAVIVRQAGQREFPWVVGLAGGIGMGIGEVVPYYVGSLSQRVGRAYEQKIPHVLKRWGDRLATPVRWLMHRFPEPTLFILSAVPNPIYEVAGLSAGSTHLSFARFIVPTVAGKIVRGMLLAYVGTRIPFG
jgi:membrane protein DedA with SNARE-associated domain